MMFPINLIGELIAVRPDEAKFSENGIRLPDWKRSLSGSILAAGPEVRNVVRGDRVSFGAAVGMDSILNGQEIRILKERDLDFIYE
jgi:co-chaperonin GroES (HSP10)